MSTHPFLVEMAEADGLANRTGVLTQAAPAVNMVFWESFKGKDGRTRSFQWSARGEGSVGVNGPTLITLASNLGTGLTSSGRTTIDKDLVMRVTESPWVTTEADFEAIVQAVESVLKVLRGAGNGVKPEVPDSFEYDARKYVSEYVQSRRTNHWMGTARMGAKKKENVVDGDTKVFGTDNLVSRSPGLFLFCC